MCGSIRVKERKKNYMARWRTLKRNTRMAFKFRKKNQKKMAKNAKKKKKKKNFFFQRCSSSHSIIEFEFETNFTIMISKIIIQFYIVKIRKKKQKNFVLEFLFLVFLSFVRIFTNISFSNNLVCPSFENLFFQEPYLKSLNMVAKTKLKTVKPFFFFFFFLLDLLLLLKIS